MRKSAAIFLVNILENPNMNLHNIHSIARYEVKLLRRSWLFRIFAILALLGITGLLFADYTVVLNNYKSIWPQVALSSLIPFTTIYFYNVAQSIIVIFLAGSFLKRDKKLDTAEVIYVRPMSNADYIIGKTWGILKVFLILNLIMLVIAGFINLLITQSPFSVFPYLFYLLTLSVPSLLFVLGLSFTLMCLLKNQAVTFIVMLGIIGTVFFYLTENCYGIFDFFGVSIPAIFSDVTGHADLRFFLLQRIAYLSAGIGLITFTIALVKRLPHRPWKIIIVRITGSAFLLVACASGFLYVHHYQHQLKVREQYIKTFNAFAERSHAVITKHELTIAPNGRQLKGQSLITLENPSDKPLSEILCYLNPGLQLTDIRNGANSLPFEREHQVIRIKQALAPHEQLALSLDYSGFIDETICYTDITEEEYLNTKIDAKIYRTGKRYAWLDNIFTLLTPECLWYPVTVAPVNPAATYNIRKNFTRFTLTVEYYGDKTVLSQGQASVADGRITFTPDYPLPSISLVIADYEKKAIRVDSVSYEIYNFRGHDYFSKHFTRLQDTLPSLLRDMKDEIEVSKNRNYPFAKFVLAEVPAQFTNYIRNWKGYTESVMPEIVFIAERGIHFNFDIEAIQRRHLEWRRHDQSAPDPLETDIMMFQQLSHNFTTENIRRGMDFDNPAINPYNIAPMFFNHNSFISSEHYPVMDIVLNTMQQFTSEIGFRPWEGIINNKQRANLYLESHSLKQAVSDPELKPEILYELIKLKSQALRNYITARVSIKEFDDFLKVFFSQYHFQNITFQTFTTAIQQKFGMDISDFIQEWYTVDHSPTLFISHVDANQVVINEETKYQTKFKINNPSDLDAIITTSIEEGSNFMEFGGRRRGMRMSVESESTPHNYIIPAGQACEIRIITDGRPVSASINTNISHNLPSAHNFNFPKIESITQDTSSGIFPIDPAIFKPNPNEIIIDNEDSGFRTIASNNRHKLKDLFHKQDEEKYKNFLPWFMPSQWTVIAAGYCYGEAIQSAVYKRKGSGNNSVEWKTEIPQDDYYDVAIWNPKSNMHFRVSGDRRGRRNQEERNQTYLIHYDEEQESITLDLEQENEGWVSLGNFYLPKGTVTITLTDKVSGNHVIADAVKFTRATQ